MTFRSYFINYQHFINSESRKIVQSQNTSIIIEKVPECPRIVKVRNEAKQDFCPWEELKGSTELKNHLWTTIVLLMLLVFLCFVFSRRGI